MKRQVKWEGVYPAVTTKFTASGDLDVPTYLKNIEAQIQAGVDGIIIPVKGSAQVTSEAVKRSAGALLKVTLCKERDLTAVMEDLQKSGLQIVACSEKTEDLLYDVDYTIPTAIVMGSEDNGITSHILKGADKTVAIPMKGEIESLNVSVSAGIILYEAVRQRR